MLPVLYFIKNKWICRETCDIFSEQFASFYWGVHKQVLRLGWIRMAINTYKYGKGVLKCVSYYSKIMQKLFNEV